MLQFFVRSEGAAGARGLYWGEDAYPSRGWVEVGPGFIEADRSVQLLSDRTRFQRDLRNLASLCSLHEIGVHPHKPSCARFLLEVTKDDQ